MAAIEVRGTGGSSKPVKVEILNNTILFTWSRLRDMGDMGYAVRGMTAANYVIKGNILGLSVFSGLDLTRVDSNVKLKKDVALDGNILISKASCPPATNQPPTTTPIPQRTLSAGQWA